MKILMATDGSVHASTAMLTATRLLGEKPAEVDVVSVGPELAPCLAGGGARGHREYEKGRRPDGENPSSCPEHPGPSSTLSPWLS